MEEDFSQTILNRKPIIADENHLLLHKKLSGSDGAIR